MIRLTDHPIQVEAVLQASRSPDAGAVVLFLGTVRSESQGQTVACLEYECYSEMAERVLHQLADEARSRWTLQGCAIVHRIGRVEVGEISVAIACSAAHRAPAFQAAQWLIDQIKQQAPIWKKEVFADGAVRWVAGQEPGRTHPVGPGGSP
ncbi:MAG TPA: molybdenum cofactor biosynthesis protein MoaE [Thermoguttaceae bacterium]|nr:molybdenum cofactor biosynthesis protein MoaE [Thermoguttaceae bacterium]